MARSQNTNGSEDASGDVDRYRQAAEDGLQQLDWAIGYLHGIRKTGIRRRGPRTARHVRTRLMDRPEEPMRGQRPARRDQSRESEGTPWL